MGATQSFVLLSLLIVNASGLVLPEILLETDRVTYRDWTIHRVVHQSGCTISRYLVFFVVL